MLIRCKILNKLSVLCKHYVLEPKGLKPHQHLHFADEHKEVQTGVPPERSHSQSRPERVPMVSNAFLEDRRWKYWSLSDKSKTVMLKGTPISRRGHCPLAVFRGVVLEYAPSFLTGQSWGSLAEAPFDILSPAPRRENWKASHNSPPNQ